MLKELRPVHDLIACDLCHRTILKGERIESFVGSGDRQRVCELCSIRALRSGWKRESELERQPPDRKRSRPRRSLWSLAVTWVEEQGLWGAPPAGDDEPGDARSRPPSAPAPPAAGQEAAEWGRAPAPAAVGEEPAPGRASAPARPVAPEPEEAEWVEPVAARSPQPAELEQEDRHDGDADRAAAMARRPARSPNVTALKDLIPGRRREPREVQAVPTGRWGKIDRALELFNGSEHRRTIAGIGRTLGEPWVSAAPLEDGPAASQVRIVVAWEISWYQYRVDLDDVDDPVLLADRGNEVDDLDEPLRAWNVGADAEGRLALAVEAVS